MQCTYNKWTIYPKFVLFFFLFCYIDFSNLFESMVWLYWLWHELKNYLCTWNPLNLWNQKILLFLNCNRANSKKQKMNDEKREIKNIWWFHLPSSNLDAIRFTITCFFGFIAQHYYILFSQSNRFACYMNLSDFK